MSCIGEESPEAYYNSKIQRGTVRDQGVVISFMRPKQTKPSRKGKKRAAAESYEYKVLEQINAEHTAYIQGLTERLHPHAVMQMLYNSDLTGAKIKIKGKEGFVAEERKNAVIVVFKGDVIKCYSKKNNTFEYALGGISYFFLCSNLRKTRFVRKTYSK